MRGLNVELDRLKLLAMDFQAIDLIGLFVGSTLPKTWIFRKYVNAAAHMYPGLVRINKPNKRSPSNSTKNDITSTRERVKKKNGLKPQTCKSKEWAE